MKDLNEEEKARIRYLTEIIKGKSDSNRFNAINEIGFNPDISYLAIPALIESFEYISSSYTGQTLWALRNFSKKAYPYLLSALKSESKKIRYYACCLLPNEYYSEIVPIIIPLLKGDDFDDKRNISWFFNRRNERFIPLVRQLLTDENPKVRSLIVSVLDYLDKKIVVNLLPELGELLKHPNSSLYDRILYSLIRIGSEAKQLLSVIIEKLDFRYPEVPFYAALVLASMGSDAKEAIPKLSQKLKDEDKYNLKTVFALALTKIEGQHNEGMDVLLELYKNGDLPSNFERDFAALLAEYKIDKELIELERKTQEKIQLAENVSNDFKTIKDEITSLTDNEMKAIYEEKLSKTEDLISDVKGAFEDQLQITNDLLQINKESNISLQIAQLNQNQLIEQVEDLYERPRLTEEQRSDIIGKKSLKAILIGQAFIFICGILVELFASDIGEFNFIGIGILSLLIILNIIISILTYFNKV